MPTPTIDTELLRRFERGLNPRLPERSAIPAKVLGYGEISTVFEMGAPGAQGLAYKRLPMFRTEQEAVAYQSLFHEYVDTLQQRIGLNVVPSDMAVLMDGQAVIAYIVQERLPAEAIGHRAMQRLSQNEVTRLVQTVLRETAKVFRWNREHAEELELGFDGQISNWGIVGRKGDDFELVYFDTSTPLTRRNGIEQLDPELFLRSAPSFMVWIIRMLFLQDVMTRYYDFRRVAVDLIANFYKEQRAELIPGLVDAANAFFAADEWADDFAPITVKEIADYYREDVWIWRVYLAFRKMDRSLHRLLRKRYPYILPEKIKR